MKVKMRRDLRFGGGTVVDGQIVGEDVVREEILRTWIKRGYAKEHTEEAVGTTSRKGSTSLGTDANEGKGD